MPFDSGHYPDLRVDTWRPIDGKRKTEMKRFFVGGTPELEELAYCGNTQKGNATSGSQVVSRYGFATASSGSIKIRLDVIHQSQAFLPEDSTGGASDGWAGNNTRWKQGLNKTRQTMLMDRLSSATLFSSVSSVLEAFQHAKERISKATEGFVNDQETPIER